MNAFAGSMRTNLVKMLDYVGVNELLSISTCATLLGDDFDRVEMTSSLKEATHILKNNGEKEMFKDVPQIDKSAKLTNMFNEGILADCKNYDVAKLFVAVTQKQA